MSVYFWDKVPHVLLNALLSRLELWRPVIFMGISLLGSCLHTNLPCAFQALWEGINSPRDQGSEYLVLRSLEETSFLKQSQITQSESVCENALHYLACHLPSQKLPLPNCDEPIKLRHMGAKSWMEHDIFARSCLRKMIKGYAIIKNTFKQN